MGDVLIKLTGLWERERRGNPGNTYWTGRLGAAKLGTRKAPAGDRVATIWATAQLAQRAPQVSEL
jgi:hypothetical protein